MGNYVPEKKVEEAYKRGLIVGALLAGVTAAFALWMGTM